VRRRQVVSLTLLAVAGLTGAILLVVPLGRTPASEPERGVTEQTRRQPHLLADPPSVLTTEVAPRTPAAIPRDFPASLVTFTGSVLDARSQAVPGAQVVCLGPGPTSTGTLDVLAETTTDARGQWQVEAPCSRDMDFTLIARDARRSGYQVLVRGHPGGRREGVTLRVIDSCQLDVRVRYRGSERSASGVVVSVASSQTLGVPSDQTGVTASEGDYSFFVPPGPCAVRVNLGDGYEVGKLTTVQAPRHFIAIDVPDPDQLRRMSISVHGVRTASAVHGGPITGTLRIGRTWSRFLVTAGEESIVKAFAPDDARERVTLVLASPSALLWSRSWPRVAEIGPTPHVDVDLGSVRNLKVRLVGSPSRSPLPLLSAKLERRDGAGEREFLTDRDGMADVVLAPGEYSLSRHAEGSPGIHLDPRAVSKIDMYVPGWSRLEGTLDGVGRLGSGRMSIRVLSEDARSDSLQNARQARSAARAREFSANVEVSDTWAISVPWEAGTSLRLEAVVENLKVCKDVTTLAGAQGVDLVVVEALPATVRIAPRISGDSVFVGVVLLTKATETSTEPEIPVGAAPGFYRYGLVDELTGEARMPLVEPGRYRVYYASTVQRVDVVPCPEVLSIGGSDVAVTLDFFR
jgi:hypothetical protein